MRNQARIREEEGCRVRIVHLDRVKQARKEAMAAPELERLAMIFKVLGDPTRLRIVVALDGGEMCVCDLAAYLGLSESAVSHQLRRMREHALVKPRREGQVLYYALDDGHVSDLVRMGLEHIRE